MMSALATRYELQRGPQNFPSLAENLKNTS